MYHSIIFDDTYNTYATWHLIPTNRPVMGTSDVEYVYSSIPPFTPYFQQYMGRGVNIKRSGSWDFVVDHRYSDYSQPVLFSEIQSAIHGKVCRIRFEDDHSYYYIGKVRVRQWNPDAHFSTISIEADCDPFKYGNRVTETITTQGATITNQGKFTAPMIVTVNFGNASQNNEVTLTGMARDKITGDAESITVRATEPHASICIDGEKKIVYKQGSSGTIYQDIDMWSFPSIKPGNNIFGVSGLRDNSDSVVISYAPRFL